MPAGDLEKLPDQEVGEDRHQQAPLTYRHSMLITALLWILAGAVLLALLWLGPLKIATRLCRRLGVSSPCPVWLGWVLWIRPGRWFRRRVLDRVGIRPGERVLEIGSGVGVFTLEAARRVGPDGALHCVDVQPQMIHMLEKRLAEMNGTVHTHPADARSLPFEDDSFDRVFLISALMEMRAHQEVLREIARVLLPAGVLSLSEEFFDPEYVFPAEHVRTATKAGFEPVTREGSWLMYTLNFRRSGGSLARAEKSEPNREGFGPQ